MKFDVVKLLFSLGYVLDLVEMDILGIRTNHSKRVAYMSLKLGKYLGLSNNELLDVFALAILHDNGMSKYSFCNVSNINSDTGKAQIEDIKGHCTEGEENVFKYPFLTDVKNVIKYHHENYVGTGFFGVKGNDIPLMSQIIFLADSIDNNFDLNNSTINDRNKIITFVNKNKNILFSPLLVEVFGQVSMHVSFWLDLKDPSINHALSKIVPEYTKDLTWDGIREFTSVFSNIIDSKSHFTRTHSSGLAQKVSIMAKYYKKSEIEKKKLVIAADLHDIGKLAINNSILNKPGKLTNEEMNLVQSHTYYTRVALSQIQGFEDITEWASNHHEKLDGSGYPYGIKGKMIDFNSRLLGCLDIYQALLEKRPYREGLNHNESINILDKMAKDGLIEKEIVYDIKKVFG